MSTATDTATEALRALDWEPACEAKTVYVTRIDGREVVLDERENTCDNVADVIVTIHNWSDHTYRQKYLCLDCLAAVTQECYGGCGAPNITTIVSLRHP